MPEPRTFRFHQATERSIAVFNGALPPIDKTRAVGVYVRQSKNGADTSHGESRETQLALQSYAALLFGDSTISVRLYDEGAGVSGQKRIDQRKELDRLYQDINKNEIGTVVVAMENRLFRNKHLDQVSTFTQLAERMRITLIIPPVISNETRLYDFTNSEHLGMFQEQMIMAYKYISHQVSYMNMCKENKAKKGGYDGRSFPPGLVVERSSGKIVLYKPWADKMKKLALRAQELGWRMAPLSREIDGMVFLFPEIPEEDRKIYIFKTTLGHIPGVGYKPLNPATVKRWFTSIALIGWWQPDDKEPDVIIDHHPAVLDRALFEEGYIALMGYTLESKPVETCRTGVIRPRKKRQTLPDAIFYGRLLTVAPDPDVTVSVFLHYMTPGNLHYRAMMKAYNEMLRTSLFSIPAAAFDSVVVNRLRALSEADDTIRDKVKLSLEQVRSQHQDDFVSIFEQLKGIETQLTENAKKRMKTRSDDPMYKMLEDERDDLISTQKSLEAKRDRLGIVDSQEEIQQVHDLLGNFDEKYPKYSVEEKQRLFSLLISRIEVEVISPHWLRLSIDWLDAICPRTDVAYLWRYIPMRGTAFTEDENAIIQRYYPYASRMEILKMLPTRTWASIMEWACMLGVERNVYSHEKTPKNLCYGDVEVGGRFLFGDYETTMHIITEAKANAKAEKFYAYWLLPDNLYQSALTPSAWACRYAWIRGSTSPLR